MIIPIYVSTVGKVNTRAYKVVAGKFNIEVSRLVRRVDDVGGKVADWYFPSTILIWKRVIMPNTSKEKGRKIFYWEVMLNLGIIRINWTVHLPF